MDAAFRDFAMAALRAQAATTNAGVEKTLVSLEDVAHIKTTGDALIACAKQHRKDLSTFVRTRMEQLQSVKRILVSKQARSPEAIKLLTKTYNTVNDALGFTHTFRDLVRDTTHFFTEFVKGITYFASEVQPMRRPVYHRDASCGSRAVASDAKFARTSCGPDASRYVRRCLLERLIYDRLYTHNVGYQDVGHRYELWLINGMFDQYYPTQNLEVELEYDRVHAHVPRNLIVRLHINGAPYRTWTYAKTYSDTSYGDAVEFSEIGPDGMMRAFGTQMFEGAPVSSLYE